MLFLVDEARMLGTMSLLETVRDALRKYGITLVLVYQSVGQLDEIWGRLLQRPVFPSRRVLFGSSRAKACPPCDAAEPGRGSCSPRTEPSNDRRPLSFTGAGQRAGPARPVAADLSRHCP